MKKGSTILVVDDNEDHRFLTVGELRKLRASFGFEVEEAETGEDALRWVESFRKEGRRLLIMSDYRMPGMSGLEFLKAVRRLLVPDQARFVFFTSMEHSAETAAGLAAGAQEFTVKPMELDQFRAQIRSIVRRWAGPTKDA